MISTIILNKLVESIVQHQELIIGPLAFDQAKKVQGITIQDDKSPVIETKTTDPDALLEDLVEKYRNLFGQISVEVCKDAIKESNVEISDEDLPKILR